MGKLSGKPVTPLYLKSSMYLEANFGSFIWRRQIAWTNNPTGCSFRVWPDVTETVNPDWRLKPEVSGFERLLRLKMAAGVTIFTFTQTFNKQVSKFWSSLTWNISSYLDLKKIYGFVSLLFVSLLYFEYFFVFLTQL